MGRIADVALNNLSLSNAELKTLLNQLRNTLLYQPLGNPGFAISTNFDVKNANAISYVNGGTIKTLSANTNFDTGTTATFPQGKFGAALLSITASGTADVSWKTNTSSGYATEALAIAALTHPGSDYTVLGYVTVQAHASNSFTAGTDALTTGTGGNVAAATTYYNLLNPNSLMFTTAASYVVPAGAPAWYSI